MYLYIARDAPDSQLCNWTSIRDRLEWYIVGRKSLGTDENYRYVMMTGSGKTIHNYCYIGSLRRSKHSRIFKSPGIVVRKDPKRFAAICAGIKVLVAL
jgi:hypothetical protein